MERNGEAWSRDLPSWGLGLEAAGMVGNGAEAEKASGSGAGSIAGSGGEAGGRVEEEGEEEEEEEVALHLHGGGAPGTCAPFPGAAGRWAMGGRPGRGREAEEMI